MFRAIARQNINLDADEIALLMKFIAAGNCVDGEEIIEFEDAFAKYHGCKHAIALSSGRAALYCILSGLNLPEGSEIIVPAYSFFTVPDVVQYCGFTVVFAPCDPKTYALDPTKIEQFITKNTQAIVVEHPYGQPADTQQMTQICVTNDIKIIEDPSQSIGASLHGKKTGSEGHAACFSLVHGKNLMAFGGGMILTDDDELYAKIMKTAYDSQKIEKKAARKIGVSGLSKWFLTSKFGYNFGLFPPFYMLNLLGRDKLDGLFVEEQTTFNKNYVKRMTNIQAALGLLQLAKLDLRNTKRRLNAEKIMSGLASVQSIEFPEVIEGGVGTWNALPIRVENPEDVQRKLMLKGIDTRADYMSSFAFEDEWNRYNPTIYLPNHPGMSDADVDYVIEIVKKILG